MKYKNGSLLQKEPFLFEIIYCLSYCLSMVTGGFGGNNVLCPFQEFTGHANSLFRMAFLQWQFIWISHSHAIRRKHICIIIELFIYTDHVLDLLEQQKQIMLLRQSALAPHQNNHSLYSLLSRLLAMKTNDLQGFGMIRLVKMICDSQISLRICKPLSCSRHILFSHKEAPLCSSLRSLCLPGSCVFQSRSPCLSQYQPHGF